MKISKIILPLILLIACSLPSMAQTQYEYAVVTQTSSSNNVFVSINGEEYYRIDSERGEDKGWANVNPALRKIAEMNKEGWSVFETSVSAYNVHNGTKDYIFYLRREKK